jgi:hypothetical protein
MVERRKGWSTGILFINQAKEWACEANKLNVVRPFYIAKTNTKNAL